MDEKRKGKVEKGDTKELSDRVQPQNGGGGWWLKAKEHISKDVS